MNRFPGMSGEIVRFPRLGARLADRMVGSAQSARPNNGASDIGNYNRVDGVNWSTLAWSQNSFLSSNIQGIATVIVTPTNGYNSASAITDLAQVQTPGTTECHASRDTIVPTGPYTGDPNSALSTGYKLKSAEKCNLHVSIIKQIYPSGWQSPASWVIIYNTPNSNGTGGTNQLMVNLEPLSSGEYDFPFTMPATGGINNYAAILVLTYAIFRSGFNRWRIAYTVSNV